MEILWNIIQCSTYNNNMRDREEKQERTGIVEFMGHPVLMRFLRKASYRVSRPGQNKKKFSIYLRTSLQDGEIQLYTVFGS